MRDFWSALEPWHQGVYVNFLGDEGAERVREAYGSEKYSRLKALKQKYDPENFFRLNQNIAPRLIRIARRSRLVCEALRKPAQLPVDLVIQPTLVTVVRVDLDVLGNPGPRLRRR